MILANPPAKSRGIFYLCFLGFTFSSFVSFAQPQMQVEDTKKNFGFVKRGEVLVNKYVIFNKGNAPLIVTNAEVECSCTSVDYPKRPVLPGNTDTIVVSFNTASVYGRQDRIVKLFSNDLAGPAILRFKAIVKNQ